MRTDFDPKVSIHSIPKRSVTDLINELYIPDEVTEIEEVPEDVEPQTEKEKQMIDQLVDKVLEG
jgi:NH3-dependent NAD+ synthetase